MCCFEKVSSHFFHKHLPLKNKGYLRIVDLLPLHSFFLLVMSFLKRKIFKKVRVSKIKILHFIVDVAKILFGSEQKKWAGVRFHKQHRLRLLHFFSLSTASSNSRTDKTVCWKKKCCDFVYLYDSVFEVPGRVYLAWYS